jgi:hypothetical protein
MLSFFDYIFYRAYKLGIGRSKAPMSYAVGIVVASQFFSMLMVFAIAKSVFGFSYLPDKVVYIGLAVFFITINWYRYERNPRLDEMNEKWGGEEDNKKLVKGWLIVICIAFLVVTPLYIAKKDYDSRHPHVPRVNRVK